MPLTFATVPFGPPAIERLGALVDEAKAGDPLAPVTVVVANNITGVAARRALAARGGIAAVGFLTMHRLAEQLAGARLADAGRRPASPPVIAAAIRGVLRDDPGVFESVRDHEATEAAMVDAFRELSRATTASLAALAACGARAADVVRICGAAREQLAAQWFDEADLMREASAAIDASAAAGLGPVIVHLPREIGRPEATLLRALADHAPVRILMGTTGDARADHVVAEAAARLEVDVAAAPPANIAHAHRIVSVSDPDEEVRAATHELLDAMRAGVPLARTAIVYGTTEPYARLVHEQLEAAGLPHNGAAVRTIGDALLGRTLRGLLGLPDHGYRRTDVLGLLACNFILGADGHRVPSRAWDRVSRAAGVVDGDDWDARLAAFADHARITAAAHRADEEEWRAWPLERDADFADSLRSFVADLRADLDASSTCTTWAAFVDWIVALLQKYMGGEARRFGWPDEELQAATRVEEALDRLRGLDAVASVAPSLAVFRRSLQSELDASVKRVGRFGEGVLVSHITSAVGLLFDRVIVLGLAEGAFPARRQEDSLLPDRERERTNGDLRPRTARVDDDHRALLAVIAGAGQATLTFPRGDLRRRGERTASRWLLDSVRALATIERTVFTSDLARFRDEPWFHEVPSHTGGIARRAFPAAVEEYDLACLLRDGVRRDEAGRHAVVTSDPVSARGVELVLARASDRFTRFDGNLGGLGLPIRSPAADDVVMSPTRLEAWARCPHGYLMQNVLGVEVQVTPERQHTINPLDLGSLVHDVLEKFVQNALGKKGAPATWTEADRAWLLAYVEQVCDDFHARGLTGREVFWKRDRAAIIRDLDQFLDEDHRQRRERGAAVRPIACEHEFGLGGAHPPVEFSLDDGRVVAMRGKIDRVDRASDGSLVVVDYKTGRTTAFAGLSAEEPTVRGTKLQLPVYAAAARAAFGKPTTRVHGAYWFITKKGEWKWIGYDITDDVDKQMVTALSAITAGIENGVFVARPNPDPPYTFVDCHYCNPDGLGSGDRRREWERKRTDPALHDYAAFAEPELLEER